MASRLANDEILIEAGSFRPVTLRPSLRAATRLESRHGFPALAAAIVGGNLTIMRQIIIEGAADDPADLLDELAFAPLGKTLGALQEPLLRFVMMLAGIDPDETDTDPKPASPSGKPFSLADYHRRLFEIATGWIGWTPADAWDATPAEILAAFEGRQDMLKAIFGSGEDATEAEPSVYSEPVLKPDGTDSAFDRAGIDRLRALMSH